MPETPVRLFLELGGEVDLSTLRGAFGALSALLRDIEMHVTNEAPRVIWHYPDRARLGAVATPNGVAADTLHEIVRQARAGFERVAETKDGTVKWPDAFGPKAKNAVKKIVKTLDRVPSISIDTETVAPLVIRSVKLLEEYGSHAPRPEFESIDGLLDLISVRGNLHFSIEQHGSGRRLTCVVGDKLLEDAKEHLGKRVVVEGLLHYNKSGQPYSLTNVKKIWRRPEPTRAVEDLVGALPDFTGGVDAAEYVRRLREGGGDGR